MLVNDIEQIDVIIYVFTDFLPTSKKTSRQYTKLHSGATMPSNCTGRMNYFYFNLYYYLSKVQSRQGHGHRGYGCGEDGNTVQKGEGSDKNLKLLLTGGVVVRIHAITPAVSLHRRLLVQSRPSLTLLNVV